MYNPYQGRSFRAGTIGVAENIGNHADLNQAPGIYGGAPDYGAYGAPPGMGESPPFYRMLLILTSFKHLPE